MSVQSGVTPGRAPLPRLAILGRAGEINEQPDARVNPVEEWRARPGSLRVIARLSAAHFRLIVVANQPGIARGAPAGGILSRIHARMHAEAAREGGGIEAACYCPHGIPCVGDSLVEVEAARAAGARPIPLSADGMPVSAGSDTYEDLASAVSVLIGEQGLE